MARVPVSALALALIACLAFPACNSVSPVPPPPGPTFTLLYSFTGGTDGANASTAIMVRDAQGRLYGTTQHAGDNNCNPSTHPGCGTLFRLGTTGTLTVRHTFEGGLLGLAPSGLVLDANGNLYGTAGGGLNYGLVFEVTNDGTYTELYNFAGGSDGSLPTGNLLQDAAGNLYGTTWLGGGSNDPLCSNSEGCGTVFQLGPAGQYKVVYSFLNIADGERPQSLTRDNAGDFLGVTTNGGEGCVPVSGCGTIFKLDATGKKTVLYTFTGGNDGGNPGSLIVDSEGNLYGTTFAGGDLACPYGGGAGCGVVFKLDLHGVETVLHAFHGGSDGSVPVSVIPDAAGGLYGTTQSGPNSGICGTVFRLDTTGNLHNLHSFPSGGVPDGCNPVGALVQDAVGNLYGATVLGGDENNQEICLNGCGTVFKIQP